MSEKLEPELSAPHAAMTSPAAAVSLTPADVDESSERASSAHDTTDADANAEAEGASAPTSLDESQASILHSAEEREAEALASLYRQAVHLTEPEPGYAGPDQPITKMTHHEIRVMRAKAGSTETEIKAPFKETVANFVIRAFDEFLQYFKQAGESRRRKCLDVGHECIHCGKQFALEKDKKA